MNDSNQHFIVYNPLLKSQKTCKTHLYVGELPCPWPDCPNGWREDELIQLGLMGAREFRYKRKGWKSVDNSQRFSWDCSNFSSYLQLKRMVDEENRRTMIEESALPSTNYHYTSVHGLHEIISSNELWMTDFSYMNDATEIKHGINTAKDVLEELKGKHLYQPKQKAVDNWTDVLSEPVPYRICITCFCADNGDSLSQWRGYGGKDIGVSIGFNINDTFFKRGIHTRLNHVIYKGHQQRQMLTNFFHIYSVISDWNEEKGILGPKDLETTIWGKPKDLLTNLYGYLIFFKNEVFSDEREVRWVYSEDPETYDTLGIDLGPKRFRISGNQLIPYLTSRDIECIVERLSTVESKEKGRKLPISEVVVGPQENAELVSCGIREFLDIQGYKSTKLRISEVPFRPPRRG